MQLAERKPIETGWGFPGLFLLYTALFVGIAEIGQGSMLAFREFTASIISAFWGYVSVPVVCSGTQLTFAGFPMEIVLECTALHYMIIFIAGVMAFRNHSLSYRAIGIIIGTLVIFLLNILRIGIIGFIGRYFGNLFVFVHDYLWQGAFALLALLVWIIWVNGKRVFTLSFFVHSLVVFVSASLSFWMMVTFLEDYISLLATLSNVMFKMMSPFVDMPQQVIAEGRRIGYVVGSEVTWSDTTFYVLNAALLLPIASITFIRAQENIFLKRLSVAILLIGIQHMLLITADWMLVITKVTDIQSVIIWFMVMSTFIAPMLIWLLVMKIFTAHCDTDSPAPLS